ncbi:MAG TPA: maleylpyruvate isomerase N-terminal domain-containing protein [Mycobacterium sp.]|nr:maleylpyruvate isomerase N-terminal domain-containing protein [Mycobacterium sp.]
MKTAPVISAGPVDDVRDADTVTRAALANAVGRSADLWRHVDNPRAPAPGLTWSVGETAAHMVGDLREYTQALDNHVNGGHVAVDIPARSPSQLSAAVNNRHLVDVPERDPRRLADTLEETAAKYLAAAAAIDASEHAQIVTPNGLILEPAVMTCLLLGEQLIHGLDIARGAQRPWAISRDDALLVIPAVLAVAPKYLRSSRSRNVSISFELRMRGGCRYRMAVNHGTGMVTAAGEKADCVITADPVAFLLVGYGRVPQWSQIIRGKLRAGGRKPWLAAKFGTLLASP